MPGARGRPRAGGLLRGAGRARRGAVPRVRLGPRARPRAARSASPTAATSGSATGARSRDPIIAGGFWSAGGAQALRVARSDAVHRAARPAVDAGPRGQRRARPGLRSGRRPVGGGLPARPPRGAVARAMHLANLDRPSAFSDLVAAFVADPAGSRLTGRRPRPLAAGPAGWAERGPPVYCPHTLPIPERFDARPQSCLPGRRLGHPVPAGDQGAAQGDAAAGRQAGHPVRGRGGGRRRASSR